MTKSARPNALGVLMLQTRFPRLPGDIGHPASFPFPVRYRIVPGASPRRIVVAQDREMLEPFIAAGRTLIDAGATAITTSCGFLIGFQRELAAALPVPVWTSSLLALPELRRPGIVTVDAASLGAQHLRAAGAPEDVPIEGLAAGCHLQRTLLDDLPELDPHEAEADAVAAACRLVARCPEIESLLLECTNLPPYAGAIEAATGRPVHHLPGFIAARWPPRAA